MSTIKVTNIQDTSGGNSSTSAEIFNGRAKAWVNFNGSGTVAIRNDYNVNTVSDRGAGAYTVNFSSALGSANYAAVGQTQNSTFSVPVGTAVAICRSLGAPVDAFPTSSAYECSTTWAYSGAQNRNDMDYVFLSFFE